MRTKLCCIRTAARSLLLLSILGASISGFSQVNFELREVVKPDNGNYGRIHISPLDVDGDSDLDILLTGSWRKKDLQQYTITELHLNDGNGNFIQDPDIPFDICSSKPAIGDVDADGDLDVIINGFCTDHVSSKLYLNDGNGNFTLAPESPFPELRENTVEFFHFDNDGLLDVFVMGRTADFKTKVGDIYRNLGGGNFQRVENSGINTGFYLPSAEFMDVDGDNDTDIVFSGENTNIIYGTYLLRNNGGFFAAPVKISSALRADIELGDYNHDGYPDLIAFHENPFNELRTVEYFLNDGSGGFVKVENHAFIYAFTPEIVSSDFDGDGDLDVFVGGKEFRGNGNVLYLNDGKGNFSIGNELMNSTQGGTAVGNFDGKGLDDILLLGVIENSKHLLYLNKTIVNEAPLVTEVNLSGTLLVGQEITATYTFEDPEGEEDVSPVKWYRAEDAQGTNEVEISEANATTYLLVEEDKEKYIRIEIIPFDGTTSANPVKSEWMGPVKMPVPKMIVKGNNLVLEEGNLALNENHTHFGNVLKNGEINRVFTIENQGTGDLLVQSLKLSGLHSSDFSLLSQDDQLIAPEGTQTFSVKFVPSDFGERLAEVTITSNDEGKPAFSFTIAGMGINSVPVYSSSSEINFTENVIGVIVDVNASDGEGGADDAGITYSISGGEDRGLFSIEPGNGHLSFISSPDFEDPLDSDKDNIYHVTVTADDGLSENNVSNQNLIITVLNSDEAPVASCLETFSLYLDGDGKASLSAEDLNNGSWDDIELTEISVFPEDFDCTDLGEQQVILTVKDSGGSTAHCTTTVYIKDNISPSIVPPADIVVDNLERACNAIVEINNPVVRDNCTEMKTEGTRSDSKPLSDPFPIGETTITWSVSDSSGNEGNPVFQKITVKDVEAPIIASVSTIEAESDPDKCGTLLTITAPGATDNCDVASVTGSRSDDRGLDEIYPIGETTISWQALDIYGVKSEIVEQKIIIKDNIRPEIEPVSAIEVGNDPDQCGKYLIVSVPNATDNCTVASVSGIRSDGGDLNGSYPIGETTISWEAVDTQGNRSGITEQKIVVTDTNSPVIDRVATIYKNCDTEACGTYIEIVPPGVKDNCNGTVLTGTRSDELELDQEFPVGTTEITWTAVDANGKRSEPVKQIVTVENRAPENIIVTGPDGPREIGTPINMKASFSDENVASVTWKAHNGNQVVQEYSSVTTGSECSHTFENLPAGVYTMIMELKDHCGKTAVGISDYVVLYDPNGGFVTGGGWFQSPAGAMTGTDVEGKAHFGFNAKYKNGKTEVGEVGGNTSFQFKAGDLDFKSDTHEKMSLVVSGGFKATYKGTGKVNEQGNFNFMVTVIDAEETSNYLIDLFRIKIWNDQGILYDNMQKAEENVDPTTAIGGGSIVIHKPSSGGSGKQAINLSEKELVEEGLEVFTAYPNPMEETAVIRFRLSRTTAATLTLYDLNGREVSRLFQGMVEKEGNYEILVEKRNLMKGVYIFRLALASGEAYQKQLIVN